MYQKVSIFRENFFRSFKSRLLISLEFEFIETTIRYVQRTELKKKILL